MGLSKYQKMRRFNETSEPRGVEERNPGGPLRFVVQKHDASKLHYDFRLELDGVLKSWAIPKGPSLDPSDKRLAVEVEDHPLEYRTFEGIIPEGNYGAGSVMVWDEGNYSSIESADRAESDQALRRGLKKGHLSFVLNGQKLKGEFSLVKMHGRGEKAWLLVKKKDEYAKHADITKKDKSVRTRRAMKAIAEDRDKVWRSNRGKKHDEEPTFIKPMLAKLVDQPFAKKNWIYEVKWDGYRAIAETSAEGDVRLYSRNALSFEKKFPPVVEALRGYKRDLVLDGEVVAVDEKGRASFQLLQNYQKTGQGQLLYCVFDLLRIDGRDVKELPLLERKRLLQDALGENPLVRYSDHVQGDGLKFFEAVGKQGLEGMMAKDGDSPYREHTRSGEWLKVKTHLRQEVVIAGYTHPRGKREYFGSLLLGVYDQKKLVYVGHTGTGFNRLTLETLHEKMAKLESGACPFEVEPKTNNHPVWLKPKLVCEVSFQEWTEDGLMRQPSFEGLRVDKSAKNVKREKVIKLREKKAKRRATTLPKQSKTKAKAPKVSGKPQLIPVTHPDKLYWPKEKITKQDLVSYYDEAAELMLPYLLDRPQSLHRYPDGIEGEGFYQKDIKHQAPKWVETIEIHSESNDKEIEYVLCQNKETLHYLANLGCIEIHPWNSRVGQLDSPDWVVIDLDPEKIGFEKVVEAAQTVHRLLDSLEIESFCKTSGATGLHIYVPLGAEYHYDTAKQFAELVANVVNEKLPFTSVVRAPEKRQRKIYLDYLQNRRGQTLAAPYSVRPRPGAPVSTPLEWKEVRKGLDPTSFTIKNILKRVEKKGDLFQAVLKKKTDLRAVLERLAQKQAA